MMSQYMCISWDIVCQPWPSVLSLKFPTHIELLIHDTKNRISLKKKSKLRSKLYWFWEKKWRYYLVTGGELVDIIIYYMEFIQNSFKLITKYSTEHVTFFKKDKKAFIINYKNKQNQNMRNKNYYINHFGKKLY